MRTIIVLLVIVGIIITSAVYAAGHRDQKRMENCQTVDIKKVKQFQKETSDLRDDFVIKRLEFHNEKMKQIPDTGRIATLTNEIKEIRHKIKGVADKYEVPLGCMKWLGRNMHENPDGSE
jgi:peptidoglycan hydrolase CwlO-like protein